MSKETWIERNIQSEANTRFAPKSVGGGHVAVHLRREPCAQEEYDTLKEDYEALYSHLEEQAEAQRRPNSPPPPRPDNGEEIFWIDLADSLHVEISTFFPPPDGGTI